MEVPARLRRSFVRARRRWVAGHSAQRGDPVLHFLRPAKVLRCSFSPRAAFSCTSLISTQEQELFKRTRGKLSSLHYPFSRANTELTRKARDDYR